MSQHRILRQPHSGSTFLSNLWRKRPHLSNHDSPNGIFKQYQPIREFEEMLTKQLESLKPEGDESILRLNWLQQAIDVALETHREAEELMPPFQFPLSDNDEKWINEYLDETKKILDVCNVLSASISEIEHLQLLLRHAAHTLDSRGKFLYEGELIRASKSLSEWTETIRSKKAYSTGQLRKESCSVLLQNVSDSLKAPKEKAAAKGKGFFYALYGSKATTFFVCSVLALALSRESNMADVKLRLSDQCLWSTSIIHLLQLAKEEARQHFSDGSNMCLCEWDRVQISLGELADILAAFLKEGKFPLNKDQEDGLALAVQNLQRFLDAFVNGLSQVEKRLNDFFHAIIASRSALIDRLGNAGNVM